MSQQLPTDGTDPSVLQRSFSLAELLDLGAFREVCNSYSALFQIGFKDFFP